MNVSIVLDHQSHTTYTNLDVISGKVHLQNPSSASVASIVVKLEGESRTRLLPPVTEDEPRPKPQLELHKILYKILTVFPPAEVTEARGKQTFTLAKGQHEYSFSFKLPFNNTCSTGKSNSNVGINFANLSLEVSKPSTRHVKQLLPPTLSGFPGEAEIRYFVKVTVNRPTLFKENPRSYIPFNFLPIERPRPPLSDAEAYARRRYQFASLPSLEGQRRKSKIGSMFSSKKAQEEVPGLPEAPFFTVDARLPEPPILTCNEDIPLRIVFATLNEETNGLFLQSLQVELVGYTHVRAHEVYRQESSPWILMSKSNMADRIIFPAGGTECVLDDRHWRGQLLPNNVAPSFVTCNITRKYELVARLGIRYQPQTQGSQLQYTSMELRLPVEVYSGIRPPPQLLEAIGHKVPPQHHTPTAGSPAGKFDAAGSVPPRKPTRTPTSPAMPPRSPATQGDDSSTAAPAYSEAPPSYEDAIAMDLPPVDGPRRDYVPPTPAADDDPLMRDEKRGWH